MVVVKTYTTELAEGDTQFETRAMGLTVGMRGWGFLLSPGISGLLSDPLKQYPHFNSYFGSRCTFGHYVLQQYPYLLPNVAGAIICLLSIATASVYLEETVPDDRRRPISDIWHDIRDYCIGSISMRQSRKSDDHTTEGSEVNPLLQDSRASSSYGGVGSYEEPRTPAYADDNNNHLTTSNNATVTQEVNFWKIPETRNSLCCYWMWSLVVISLDEMFPLFCLSTEGGLGWTEATIGKVLSASGLPYVIAQYFVFTCLMRHCGMYKSLCVSSLLGIPPIAFLPLVLLWHSHTRDAHQDQGGASNVDYMFLGGLLATCRVFASSYFAVISLVLNRSVDREYRGKLQGLSMSGSSLFKGIGPAMAGALYSFCVSSPRFFFFCVGGGGSNTSSCTINPQIGSFVAFGILALLGLAVSITTAIVMKPSSTSISTHC
jgi:hypothetical protein